MKNVREVIVTLRRVKGDRKKLFQKTFRSDGTVWVESKGRNDKGQCAVKTYYNGSDKFTAESTVHFFTKHPTNLLATRLFYNVSATISIDWFD